MHRSQFAKCGGLYIYPLVYSDCEINLTVQRIGQIRRDLLGVSGGHQSERKFSPDPARREWDEYGLVGQPRNSWSECYVMAVTIR